MQIRDLLKGFKSGKMPECKVLSLQVDSRKIIPGSAFVAVQGTKTDGRKYLKNALNKGACAVLIDENGADQWIGDLKDEPIVTVTGLQENVAVLFSRWYGNPAESLVNIGVTGTNGKSTTVRLISSVLDEWGKSLVQLGTVGYLVDGKPFQVENQLTTPSPQDLYSILATGVAAGCTHLVMEVSSHSLKQNRTGGINYDYAVFTNLTQDHLDYHKDLEEYFASKSLLFTKHLKNDGTAVVNLDDPYGKRLAQSTEKKCITFSRYPESGANLVLNKQNCDLHTTRIEVSWQGTVVEIQSRLIGGLNIENLLAAATCCLTMGVPSEYIQSGMAKVSVPGRNEIIEIPGGGTAVVDYAHTPDALDRVLQSLRPLVSGRLICLFGCGGDRDRGKRSQMAQKAAQSADYLLITNDNPRTEDPGQILEDIKKGLPGKDKWISELDRKKAIHKGLSMLRSNDCLLVAGKGHEDYQILGNEKIPFSDQGEILSWIRKRIQSEMA